MCVRLGFSCGVSGRVTYYLSIESVVQVSASHPLCVLTGRLPQSAHAPEDQLIANAQCPNLVIHSPRQVQVCEALWCICVHGIQAECAASLRHFEIIDTSGFIKLKTSCRNARQDDANESGREAINKKSRSDSCDQYVLTVAINMCSQLRSDSVVWVDQVGRASQRRRYSTVGLPISKYARHLTTEV